MDAEELLHWQKVLDTLKAENPNLDDRQLFDAFISFNADPLNRKAPFSREPNAREVFDSWKKSRGL